MDKVKAVLFDMDGVLIEAKDWHYEALNKALGHFGFTISRYDHLITYDGLPTKTKLEMLSLERGLPRALHKFINELKQQYTMEIIFSKCKPVFQHQYLLSQLKQSGYKIAVCSNSIRDTIDLMMEKAGLAPFLDTVLSNQDVSKPKPDPEIYTKAIHTFNLNPKNCVIVEDNPNGLKAAYEAGGNVLRVETTKDVSYENIFNFINQVEKGQVNRA